MKSRRGLAWVAVTAGVVVAVASFVVGPAVYKVHVKPSSYLMPGVGQSLTEAFGEAVRANPAVSSQTRADQSRLETAPPFLPPLPLTAQPDLPAWKWVLVGGMTTLAGLVVVVVTIGITTQVVWWLRKGLRDARASHQGFHSENEHPAEDPVAENGFHDPLSSVQGFCYEELVGLELEECDHRDWVDAGKTEVTPEAKTGRLPGTLAFAAR